jgi:ERCC4-type nuclease
VANSEVIRVIADDRAAASGVAEALRLHADCEAMVKRLPLRDCQVGGRLLCERKTLRDLAASIVDGRSPPRAPAGA